MPVSQLRAIDVTHFGNDGGVHAGRLIVAADLAEAMVAIFRDLYDARFPIQRMEPIDVYGGDDMRSIKANNTSAFNCRAVTGGTGWSEHAYGRAIDVNPFVNPYVQGEHGAATGGGALHGSQSQRPGHDPRRRRGGRRLRGPRLVVGRLLDLAEGLPALLDDRSVAGAAQPLAAGEPAVDGEQLAGDVAGAVAEQEHDRLGDLPRRALPAERHRRLGA